MKKIIGLTGTTGSGKSTVAEIFSKHGFYIIDCDKVARAVVEQDKVVLDLLAERFGQDILCHDGKLDRQLLASRAFADKDSTTALNEITLPAIIEKVLALINETDNSTIVLDAPTLFESGADGLCTDIVCVIAPIDIRVKRIIDRDKITYQQAIQRISAQYNDEFFEQNCKYVINNNGDLNTLKNSASKIAKILS